MSTGDEAEALRVDIDAIFDQALDCMAAGDAAGAAARFERVLSVEPEHAEARHGLVRALEDAGRVDDALAMTERLIADDPDDILAVTRLSMIYQHKGMIAEAEAAATRAKILGWKHELRGGESTRTTL